MRDWHTQQTKNDNRAVRSLDNIIRLLRSDTLFNYLEVADYDVIRDVVKQIEEMSDKYRK